LYGSFLTHPQADILREQGHDDLTEKLHRVFADVRANGFTDEVKKFVLGKNGIEQHQGTGTPAHRPFGAASIARREWAANRAFHTRIIAWYCGSQPAQGG
jgi:hypothetical protein